MACRRNRGFESHRLHLFRFVRITRSDRLRALPSSSAALHELGSDGQIRLIREERARVSTLPVRHSRSEHIHLGERGGGGLADRIGARRQDRHERGSRLVGYRLDGRLDGFA
jgi:hypothetical protein